jgi:hypothetical protein
MRIIQIQLFKLNLSLVTDIKSYKRDTFKYYSLSLTVVAVIVTIFSSNFRLTYP